MLETGRIVYAFRPSFFYVDESLKLKHYVQLYLDQTLSSSVWCLCTSRRWNLFHCISLHHHPQSFVTDWKVNVKWRPALLPNTRRMKYVCVAGTKGVSRLMWLIPAPRAGSQMGQTHKDSAWGVEGLAFFFLFFLTWGNRDLETALSKGCSSNALGTPQSVYIERAVKTCMFIRDPRYLMFLFAASFQLPRGNLSRE